MPTTAKKVLHRLKKHIAARNATLQRGDEEWVLTLFDFDSLDEDQKGMIVESQALELLNEAGEEWSKKLHPFALRGEEIPEDELDQQCDGVLFLDLEHGTGDDCPVLYLDDSASTDTVSLGKLSSLEFSEDDEDEDDDDDGDDDGDKDTEDED
jgi:hypothetical protein